LAVVDVDGGGIGVADLAVAGAFDGIVVVAGAFDHARTAPVAAGWIGPLDQFGDRGVVGAGQAVRGKRPPGR
jgi:hypothetical protein